MLVIVLQNRKRLALLSLGLFARLVVHADLSDGSGILPLLVNLWTQAQRHKILDKRLLVSEHTCGVCVCVRVCVCGCVCVGCVCVWDVDVCVVVNGYPSNCAPLV